ncbi:periplasmic phosphate-binding protein of phosphate ABC transporter [Nostoc carneum NIES-2107]|nr:periplasmic phosphate-binding protein of phosphate ABC transporter [Nostoc carneum NIES-2107]
MSPRNGTNETGVLVLALTITLGLVGVVFWWLANKSGVIESFRNTSHQVVQPQNDIAQTKNAFPSGLFSYGGSTTWAPIRKEVEPKMQKLWPQFQLRYTDPTTGAPGSGTGIKMLLDNQLAFSQSSRSLKDEEYQKAQQRGFKLKEIPVAIDGIAIAVHPRFTITLAT